jgi:hypothetical protein
MQVKLEVGKISLEHGTKAAKDKELLYLKFTFPQTNLKVLNTIFYNLACMCHVTAAPLKLDIFCMWSIFIYSNSSETM